MWLRDATFLLEHKYFSVASSAQKEVQNVIETLGILRILAPYRPVLAGTFPLDLQVQGSDLDILTESVDLMSFQKIVLSRFQENEGFRNRITSIRGVESFVCGFAFNGFEFEIFCQNRPVIEQDGFLHLLPNTGCLDERATVSEKRSLCSRTTASRQNRHLLRFWAYRAILMIPYSRLRTRRRKTCSICCNRGIF
ncbi:MAG: DUF4269 domain-containing protein [Leptospirales bacterium]|nr:DUF4269 domain-containing protein [Leptospirales bacterium]